MRSIFLFYLKGLSSCSSLARSCRHCWSVTQGSASAWSTVYLTHITQIKKPTVLGRDIESAKQTLGHNFRLRTFFQTFFYSKTLIKDFGIRQNLAFIDRHCAC
jgi:hypothetical protein